MGRLRAAMTSRYKERDEDVKIHMPKNCETLHLSFRGERVAKVGPELLRCRVVLNIPRLLALWQIPRHRLGMCCPVSWLRRTIRTRSWIRATLKILRAYQRVQSHKDKQYRWVWVGSLYDGIWRVCMGASKTAWTRTVFLP